MEVHAGASIQNETSGSNTGTLACFAVLRSNRSVQVLLSNRHVIFDASSTPPRKIGSPDAGMCRCCCPKNIVADADTAGREENVPSGSGPTYVDCAIARLRPGVTGVNQISGLGGTARVGGADLGGYLAGWHAAEDHERVVVASFKGFITGTVQSVVAAPAAGPGAPAKPNQIEILVDPNQGEDIVFGTGDSGAAVINRFNEIVGLMHSRGVSSPDAISETSNTIFACPIGPVLDALAIDIPSAVPAAPHAGRHLLAVPETGVEEPPLEELDDARLRALERRVRATRLGDELLDAGFRHGAEIGQLVHHCRPVTVAWHRSRGPAWTAHLLNAARSESYVLPDEIEGITRRAVLERMRDVLATHGSDSLRADLEKHDVAVLELALDGGVDEILERLDSTGQTDVARSA